MIKNISKHLNRNGYMINETTIFGTRHHICCKNETNQLQMITAITHEYLGRAEHGHAQKVDILV